MEQTPAPEPFHQTVVRRMWYEDRWFYSVVDVVAVLTESVNPNRYWNTLKSRLQGEGADDVLAAIRQLKLQSRDNRLRLTDVADRETLLRIIQSIPSPRAEPFKAWLAQVGEERFVEIEHPEAAFERIRQGYRNRGYDERWIEERMRADLIRNDLTTEWQERGATEGTQFAILTNTIHEGTFAISVAGHKTFKDLSRRENLRDHMSPIELALLSLGEATAIELHRDRDSQGFGELKRDATDAGATAGRARKVIEQDLGRPVVSAQNARAFTRPPAALPPAQPADEPTNSAEQVASGDDPDGPTQLPLFLDPL
ncbi:MAG: phage antirepressor protein [Rhodospirillales bacterium]|nr:phage antirepressor protein [Rhodospirillales bacterium]